MTTKNLLQSPRLGKLAIALAAFVIVSPSLTACTPVASESQKLPEISLVSPKPASSPPSSSESEDVFNDAFAELEIEDQIGDGKSVEIEEVRIGFSLGFVGIFDKEGKLLGSAKVTEKSQPVRLLLDVPVTSNTKLYAILFADDGNGTFDEFADLKVLDDDRESVEEDFDYQVGN